MTVTENAQLTVCESDDRAIAVTNVVPTAKRLPDTGDKLIVTGASPPEAVALYVTGIGDPFDEGTDMFAGHEIVSVGGGGGGAVYVTVTENEQLAVC